MKLSVILEAIDRVTAPVKKIGQSVRKLGADAGFRKITAAASKVGKNFGNVGKEARRMATRVTTAVGLIGGGLFMLTKRFAASGDAIASASQKIGIGVEAYQRLGYAAETAGISQDAFGQSLTAFNRQVVAASRGNKSAAAGFARLKISLRDGDGQLKTTEQLFGEVSERLAHLPDGAAKSAAAMAVFGRSGANLIPMLNLGVDGLRSAAAEAENLGLIMSKAEVKDAGNFYKSLGRLRGATSGLTDAIAARLLPTLGPLITELTTWIVKNRDLIATRVQQWIERLPGLIAKVRDTLRELLDRLQPVIAVLGAMVDRLGPTNSALLLLSILIGGKFLFAVAQLTLAFGGLSKAIVGTAWSLGKLAFMAVAGAIGNFVTALRAGYSAMAALNLVMAANPIGLIIIAVAALAAAAYMIYKHWGKISAFFSKIFDDTRAGFSSLVDWIAGIGEGITSALGGAFETAWQIIEPIVALINGALGGISSVVDKLSKVRSRVAGAANTVFGRGGAVGGDSKPTGAGSVPVTQRVQAGGELRVRIDSEGRPRVLAARSDNPRIPITVNAGRVMP